MKRSMVFGTFDTLHPGHLKLIKRASSFGEVFVSLTPDRLVQTLKKQNTKWDWSRRRHQIMRISCIAGVLPSDGKINSYSILEKVRPTHIVLGHDQTALIHPIKEALNRLKLVSAIVIAKKYRRDLYATSHLNTITDNILRHKHDK